MVSNYTKCTDGKWYQELTYMDETDHWFICFDDDDPVELVVFDDCERTHEQILNDLNFPWIGSWVDSKCNRIRPISGKFGPATAYFMDVSEKPFPLPSKFCEYSEVYNKQPNNQGVYYGGE